MKTTSNQRYTYEENPDEIIRANKIGSVTEEVNNLNYKDLLKAHAIFELISKGDKDYWDFYGKDVWSLEKLSVDTVKRDAIKFLNKWRSRIPYARADSLLDKLLDIKVHLDVLHDTSLRDADIQGLSGKIKRIFDGLEPTVGSTGASKIIHMIKPKFFVMWDRDIRKDFGYRYGLSNEYLTFMKRMQEEAENVVKNYREVHTDINSDNEAEKNIERICDRKTLAKLLDEYNWIRVHYKVKPKWECPHCNKTIELGI